jgi:hypothetical protein
VLSLQRCFRIHEYAAAGLLSGGDGRWPWEAADDEEEAAEHEAGLTEEEAAEHEAGLTAAAAAAAATAHPTVATVAQAEASRTASARGRSDQGTRRMLCHRE